MKVSICIPVYNEEKNIGYLLDSIIRQELKYVSINDIIVISSGSSDKTDNIVRKYQNEDKRIFIIKQNKREGKASAINLFLKTINNGRNSDSDIIILSSGDVIFEKYTVENLCQAFLGDNIGLASAHPVPVNGINGNLAGYIGNMHWRLHNKFKRHGETIAFRRDLISELSPTTAVDEAWIEAIIDNKGYKSIHLDDAIIRNKGPETINDFIKQRRRHYAGHLDLEKRTNYKVSSMLSADAAKILAEESIINLSMLHFFIGYLVLELYGRLLGSYDHHIKKKNYYIWDIAKTTKKLK